MFVFFVYGVSVVSAVSVTLLDSEFSKVEGDKIYYSQDPKLNVSFSGVAGNLTIKLDNVAKHIANSDGYFLLELPENKEFNLEVLEDSSSVFNSDYLTQKIKISDISTILISNNLITKEAIKYKVIINNDETAKDLVKLVSKVYDPDNNLVSEKIEEFGISSNSNLAKTFSFTPESAGLYLVKNSLYIKDFLITENEKSLDIQVTKPDVTLALARSEISIPSDVVATASIRNPKVTRDYKLLLKIFNPSGDVIDEINKEVSLTSEAIRSVLFQTSFSEELEAGEYIFLLQTEFKEGGETYTQEEQKTLTVITPSANVLVTLNTPETIEVSKDYSFILGLNHLSTKQFRYTYQCYFYDENNFLSYVYPQNPNTITLGNQEQKDFKLSFKVPSDFKTGRYTQECKVIYGNDVFIGTSQFLVKQPNNYLNLRASSDYVEGEAIVTVGYSTKSIKELNGYVNIFLLDEKDKLIDSNLNNEVLVKGKLGEFKAKFKIPSYIAPQDVKVQVELDALDETLTETTNLIELKDSLELYCSSDFVTPQSNLVSCSVAGITSTKGKVYIGITKENVEIPRIFREQNKAIFLDPQEKKIYETNFNNVSGENETTLSELSFNLNFNTVKDSKAKIVAVFVDENGLSTSNEFLVDVIPKGATITQDKTFSESYYKDDRKKPLSVLNGDFQQDITIKSNSNGNIKVKIIPRASSDRLVQIGESISIELAPNSAKTLTFLHKQTRIEPLDIVRVGYDVYLVSENKEYLIESKDIEAVAPNSYYVAEEPKSEYNAKGLMIFVIILVVLGVVIWLYFVFRKKNNLGSYTDVASESYKPHIEED